MIRNWKRLLHEGRLKPHTTSRAEIDALRGVVARDLGDAKIERLSADPDAYPRDSIAFPP